MEKKKKKKKTTKNNKKKKKKKKKNKKKQKNNNNNKYLTFSGLRHSLPAAIFKPEKSIRPSAAKSEPEKSNDLTFSTLQYSFSRFKPEK